MRMLLVMGSPRMAGNTKFLADSFKTLAEKREHTCDLLTLHKKKITNCTHCSFCSGEKHCVIQDDLSKYLNDMPVYDAMIIASPIYFFHVNAMTKMFIDRLYSTDLRGLKIGSILVSGSPFKESGTELAIESLRKTCDYCKAHWVGSFHMATNDEIIVRDDFHSQENKALNDLISNMEISPLSKPRFTI